MRSPFCGLPGVFAAIISITCVFGGCAESHEVGSLAAPCFGHGSCRSDLECWRGICVRVEDMARDAGFARDAAEAPRDGGLEPPRDAGAMSDAMPGLDAPGPGETDAASGRDAASAFDGGGATGPVDPRPPLGVHRVGAGPFDVALDWERHRLFVSHGAAGIEVLDLVDGTRTSIALATGQRAEHLHFDPYRDEVVVSLPIRDHSSYWYDGEQEGFVATIDARSLELREPIYIRLDPWDIVADGMGRAYAMGGSGQWTHIATIELDTGAATLMYGPREGTSIELHPRRDHAYSANNGLSPSDIQRIEFGVTAYEAYDSPYHGDYPMCGALRIHPSGGTIHTRCGHVFLATEVRATDMTWTGSLGFTWADLAFELGSTRMYVIREGASSLVDVYDSATLSPLGTMAFTWAPRRVLVAADYLVITSAVTGGAPATEVDVRALSML